jgi:predicted TIM-barrel fold metal-dependent hydrolase
MPMIDAHCHAGAFPKYFSGEHPPEKLVADFDVAGVGAGIIAILDGHDMASANDRALAACRAHPGRLYGYIYLNPQDVDAAIAEFERRRREPLFRGVKLHPMNDVYYPFLDDFFPLWERIEATGMPVLWHSGTSPYSHPLQIAYVAHKFPGMPCILGHFGLSDLTWECFPAADLAPNIHVDTTANPIVPVLNDWIDRFGPERMLWGSDFPFYSVAYEAQKLPHLGRSDADRALIGGGNARRLFRL